MFQLIPTLIVMMCLSATASFAEEPLAKPTQNAFSIRFENDLFAGTDENYTNGMSLALTQTGKGLLGGVWDLFGEASGNRFATYELTQLMFTPSDLSRSNPDPTDRPYAGLLYLGFTTHLERDNSLHSLKLIAGVAGPAAFAEDVQRFAHSVLIVPMPKAGLIRSRMSRSSIWFTSTATSMHSLLVMLRLVSS